MTIREDQKEVERLRRALLRLCFESREIIGIAGSLSRETGGKFAVTIDKFQEEIERAEKVATS